MTYKIVINGQVQGVGFRPFVYTTAFQYQIKGTVSNNEEGVIIYATAPKEKLDHFYHHLVEHPPVVARINGHSRQEIPEKSFDTFTIVPSEKNAQLNLQLTPDFALCGVCQKEVTQPENRRYAYPFTTCTYCGPRWAITNSFPFERDHTNLQQFSMCPLCEKEYKDPMDRRFHSQTNSCSNCGVQIVLTDAEGTTLETEPSAVFKRIASLILGGKIIAVKNTSGYLLCCDARNNEVVQALRSRKKRPAKPFAILYPSLDELKAVTNLNQVQEAALTGTERPIVLMDAHPFKGKLALEALAPGLHQIGIMLPYTALLYLMMNELSVPVVATSGNLHGSPILHDEKEAVVTLKGVADYFLHHDLEISNPQDDSVLKYSPKYQQKILFRRSRGYAPNYYGHLPGSLKKVMAMGGHLKSTIAYYPNDFLYLSQYLGNLDHYDVYQRFAKTAETFVRLFEKTPDIVLHDLHPAYGSTRFALSQASIWGAEVYGVQHHKAHFAAVLAEHHLFEQTEAVLGVIWDGTGYGEDGAVWGGEFFRYQDGSMDRLGHLEYFDWLAGDKMAVEPRLSLFSLANAAMDYVLEEKYTSGVLGIYRTMKQKNALKTSSIGRLFDAVASLLGICDHNSFEGEAAMLLENYISGYELEACKAYVAIDENGMIPAYELITRIHADLQRGIPKEQLIRNFLFTLATLIFQVADRLKIRHIACSGGVFQNATLVDMVREIGKDNYKLYFNTAVSPNDENISFGQLAYYIYLKPES